MDKIAIIQPRAPHYREQFFKQLQKEYDVEVFVYMPQNAVVEARMKQAETKTIKLKTLKIGKAIIYDVMPVLGKDYKVVILGSSMKLLSNWIMLLLGRLLGKKVILWGHGLDARRYLSQTRKLPFMRRLQYALANGAWFYTKNERQLWQRIMPKLRSVALDNTIDIDPILQVDLSRKKGTLKEKYGINTKLNFIFCARFTNPNRRADGCTPDITSEIR